MAADQAGPMGSAEVQLRPLPYDSTPRSVDWYMGYATRQVMDDAACVSTMGETAAERMRGLLKAMIESGYMDHADLTNMVAYHSARFKYGGLEAVGTTQEDYPVAPPRPSREDLEVRAVELVSELTTIERQIEERAKDDS